MEEITRPDYKFPATVSAGTVKFENVVCELRLPRRVVDPVRVRLLPTHDQLRVLANSHKFGIDYTADGVRFTAATVYWEGGGSTTWGGGVQDQELIGRAVDLTITEAGDYAPKQTAVFALTPNVYLHPWKFLVPSLRGEVTLQSQERFAFPLLDGGGWVSFDSHYRQQSTNEGTLSFHELVAECDLPTAMTAERAILQLDDFLLIVSFATRQRVICLGWSVAGPQQYLRHFRHNLVVPRLLAHHSFNDTLVFQENFTEFMVRAYSTFQGHPQQPLLRQALQRLTFYRDRQAATENFYLGLYAALESLIRLFEGLRPEVGAVLPKGKWRVLHDALKQAVHTSLAPELAEHTTDSMYSSLRSLDRASVGAVLRALCDQYRIDLSDLWPVTDDKTGITLAQIRNKLIHGCFIGPEFERSLWIARVHLEWIVERLLLAVLRWDSRGSRVNFVVLETFTPYHNWKQARQQLSAAS